MRTFSLLAVAGAIFVSPVAAQAAELFNGPFVGVQAGWTKDKVGTVASKAGPQKLDRSSDSISGGIFAGYDFKLTPRIVVGAEAGINLNDVDNLERTTGGSTFSIDPQRSLDFTARLGYLVTDRTLLYARGGYSNVRTETILRNTAGIARDHDSRDGWLVGGGVERVLTDNISTRLEYRYTDLGDGDGKFDQHQVLIGVAYHF